MEISDAQFVQAYAIAKKVYDGQLSISQGIEVLHLEHGLNEASAGDFINDYKYLRRGQVFHRTMSASAMRYFIDQILAELGSTGLSNALASLRSHIQYYEGHTKTTMHRMRSVLKDFELRLDGFVDSPPPRKVTRADLRPTTKQLVKNVVELVNIKTDDWKGVGDTYRNSQWSFGGKGEPVLLFIWWKHLENSNDDKIFVKIDMLSLANKLRRSASKNLGIKAKRAEEFHNRCLTAFMNKIPVRVALLEGQEFHDEDKADTVDARELDSEDWYVTNYDEPTNEFILVREFSGEENLTALKSTENVTQFTEPNTEPTEPTKRTSSGTTTFLRDSEVVRVAKLRANGICEYCGQQGFETAQGGFYLEAHHVIPLSCNGDDQEWNIVAICPDDHRKAHFGVDRSKMRDELIDFLGSEYKQFHEVLRKKAVLMDSDLKTTQLLESEIEI